MRKIFIAVLFLICWSCDLSESPLNHKENVKGPIAYGGSFKFSIEEPIEFLHPHYIEDLNSANIAYQIFEGLVRFNPSTLEIEPSIAENWKINDAATRYIFYLKDNVYFHNDSCFENGIGRKVTAKDVKFSIEELCNSGSINYSICHYLLNSIEGATEFHEGNANHISGLEVKNESTISINLIKPCASLLDLLATIHFSIIPPEGKDKYQRQSKIGTGPFTYHRFNKKDNSVFLKRNNRYHKVDTYGNPLPYLDSISVLYLNSKNFQLEAFKKDQIDLITGLPSEKIKQIVREDIKEFKSNPPKYVLRRNTDMFTHFYAFNLKKEIFQDIKIRKAISLAINKDVIFRKVLAEEAYGKAIHGIVPPAFKGYNIGKIRGYDFSPDSARKLLEEAGYPNGENFPVLNIKLNSGGNKHSMVAFEIQRQLKNELNIRAEVEVVSINQKIKDAKYGKADLFSYSWGAGYPSPEYFLSICYGKGVPTKLSDPSYPNIMRYQNHKFDHFYELGCSSKNKEESYRYFMHAEQLMMNDAPIIPIWYSENYRLIKSQVRNLSINPLNYLDLTSVYLKTPEPPREEQAMNQK